MCGYTAVYYKTKYVVILQTKSLYRSCARSHFYVTEYDISADFGPLAILKKTLGRLLASFEGGFFHVFVGKNFVFLKTVA